MVRTLFYNDDVGIYYLFFESEMNFMKAKKILALVLALASMFTVMSIPAFAGETYETVRSEVLYKLTPNADNWINGQNYRLETSTKDTSYAQIIRDSEGNIKLEINITKNDLFWIPSLNIKDETTTFTAEDMQFVSDGTSTTGVMALLMVTGITSRDSGDIMLATGVYRDGAKVPMWYARGFVWNSSDSGVTNKENFQGWRNDGDNPPSPNVNDPDPNDDGSDFINGYFNRGEKMSAKLEIVDLNADKKGEEGYKLELAPKVHMYENSATAEVADGKQDVYFTWKSIRPIYGGVFGITHDNSGHKNITIGKLSATNTIETASWTETFEDFDMSWIDSGKPVTLFQGYQTTAKDANGNVNIRFVATVGADYANYKNVGFEILPVSVKGKVDDYTGYGTTSGICAYPKINRFENDYGNIVELTEKNKDTTTKTLFTSILETTADGSETHTAEEFLGAGNDGYIYLVTLTGVPTDNNLHFAVRTYYTDANGNKIYGETAYIKLDMSQIPVDSFVG